MSVSLTSPAAILQVPYRAQASQQTQFAFTSQAINARSAHTTRTTTGSNPITGFLNWSKALISNTIGLLTAPFSKKEAEDKPVSQAPLQQEKPSQPHAHDKPTHHAHNHDHEEGPCSDPTCPVHGHAH